MAEARNRLKEVLSGIRRSVLTNEDSVERRLIDPCFAALGWQLVPGVNTQVWIPLTSDKARFWSYPSGRMRRDYVLDRGTLGPLHVEAKHRWGRNTFDLDGFLRRASQGDWAGSQKDGVRKDLALLLWGARSQEGTRAAIIDDSLILVFDWADAWSIRAEVDIFSTAADKVADVFLLLSPTGV